MTKTQWLRAAAGLLLFGVSFGYVEASVVVYLRTIEEPTRRRIHPTQPSDDLFPLITPEQIREQSPETLRLLGVEVGREAATLIMLAAAAMLVTGARNTWLPAFAVAFGAWDLFYYVFLKVLVGWPASLATWDILFLIPVPWAAPVLAPVIVSLSLIALGLAALWRPVSLKLAHWSLFLLGCGIILYTFMADYRNTVSGGVPHPFLWTAFALGLLGAAGSVMLAALRRA
jgi:hypothetical protein